MKILIKAIFLFNLFFSCIYADIFKTQEIDDIKNEINEENTLVLFNIAEVLLDTETSLGSQAWRKYIRTRTSSKTHDALTYLVFEKIPPKAVEPMIPEMIKELQDRGQTTFAFTSRGRHEWYASQIENIDLLTEDVMRKVNIDFSKTILHKELSQVPILFPDFFHEGIIYATNTKDKQELLLDILNQTGYYPAKVVFVDDKIESLRSIEKGLQELGIPFIGYAYSRTALNHADFDPMIANIQLDWLISKDMVLSDEQALEIKKACYLGIDPDMYFQEIVKNFS